VAAKEKIRENRLRRMADRQGLRLEKSRRRDPRAIDYDRWWIVDKRTGGLVAHAPLGVPFMTLDEVERYLRGEDDA
jgi:hypothetical protein